jgi:hypothetical protein
MGKAGLSGSLAAKLVVAAVTGAIAWGFSPGSAHAAGQTEIDYFGKNLFLGIAYHRYGCGLNGPYANSTVTTSYTYQGFTGTEYCYAGWTWDQENAAADTYLGNTTAGNLSDPWLGYYYGYANWDYGLAVGGTDATNSNDYCHSWMTGYANNDTFNVDSRSASGAPNSCGYSVVSNCNSDCWIQDFSSRQGWTVSISSPCL